MKRNEVVAFRRVDLMLAVLRACIDALTNVPVSLDGLFSSLKRPALTVLVSSLGHLPFDGPLASHLRGIMPLKLVLIHRTSIPSGMRWLPGYLCHSVP